MSEQGRALGCNLTQISRVKHGTVLSLKIKEGAKAPGHTGSGMELSSEELELGAQTLPTLSVFHPRFFLLLASFFHSDFPTRQDTWLKATLSPHRHNCQVIEYKWTMARPYVKIELTYNL